MNKPQNRIDGEQLARLARWKERNPGVFTKLALSLGVSRSYLSNVLHGRAGEGGRVREIRRALRDAGVLR